ncbi:hypothetical protein GLOIN_2v1475459 [Rhizophagus clarus]|uniref:Uncharacterized protein n=1 Tax=Rhizophagus clarus TaxID=94130 RepID=A0A8H3KWU6_9GLOM|nr:hypothetical protein GLOIN_2v1475459 [Rhizophagus clarus]
MRQESDRLNAGDNYAIGDMESEYSSPENEHNSEPESESAENDEISDIINMTTGFITVKNIKQDRLGLAEDAVHRCV